MTAFSCSSDDSGSSNDPYTMRLSKIIESNGEASFYYENNRLSHIIENQSNGDNHKVVLNYSDNTLTSLTYYKDGINTGERTFEYQSDNIVSNTLVEGTVTYLDTYNYNNESQVISSKEFQNGALYDETFYVYNSDGNMTEKSFENSSLVINYTYDEKLNPEFYLFTNAFVRMEPISKNNILTSGSTTYTYEYNEEGFPTKKTSSNGSITLYEYE